MLGLCRVPGSHAGAYSPSSRFCHTLTAQVAIRCSTWATVSTASASVFGAPVGGVDPAVTQQHLQQQRLDPGKCPLDGLLVGRAQHPGGQDVGADDALHLDEEQRLQALVVVVVLGEEALAALVLGARRSRRGMPGSAITCTGSPPSSSSTTTSAAAWPGLAGHPGRRAAAAGRRRPAGQDLAQAAPPSSVEGPGRQARG